MKILLFTSNGLRHDYLIKNLITSGYDLLVIREIPRISVNFGTFDTYFEFVRNSEISVFSEFSQKDLNLKCIDIEFGKVSHFDLDSLIDLNTVDLVLVYGSSFIRNPLYQKIAPLRPINIHMGVLPYYRGSGANFWAQYDGNFDKIGGTIHYINEGLDSGNIIQTIRLNPGRYDRFDAGMIAVKKTLDYVIDNLISLLSMSSYKQNPDLVLRNSLSKEFNLQVAECFLENYFVKKTILIR
jgi:hypothetical protein